MFGGAMEPGEDSKAAICRELQEELSLHVKNLKEFGALDFDWTASNIAKGGRLYFHAEISKQDVDRIILGEGAGFLVLSAQDCFLNYSMLPLDSFALWCFHCRSNLVQM